MKAAEVAQNLSAELMERIDGILGNKPQPDED
jgi:hypothetical protein